MKQFIREHLGYYLSVLKKDVIFVNLSDSFHRPLTILFTSFFLLFLLSTGCFGQFTVFPVIEKDQLVLPDALPDTLKLMVPAQGAIPPYGYQWQVSLDGGSSWSNIDGADTTFYRPGIIKVRTQFVLRVIDADNPHRVTSSNIVTITPLTGGWIKTKGPLDNVPNLSGPQTICLGSSGNVYVTDPGMTNYQWVVSAGGTKTAGGTTTDNTVTVTWNVAGVQSVEVRYNEATETARLKIIVNPLPTPVITGPSSVCAGSVENVYSTAAGMSNYIWAVSSGGTITAGGTATNNTVTVTWGTPGANTVSVIYTDLNNCPANTPTVYNVAVNPIPDAVATPASQTICSGQPILPIILTGSIPGTLFSWTRDNTTTVTGIAASGSGDISGTMTNTTSSPVTVTFTITPSYNGCPGSPVTATVLVNPTPSVNPVSNVTYCHGATTTEISFSGPVSGTTYAWTNSNPVIGLPASGTGNIPSFTATNPGASPLVDTITVTPAANGCQGPEITFTITVNPTNTITLTSGPGTTNQVVCNNTPVTNITYSTTGATGATFTGLPPGVTGNWVANVVTISGSPTVAGLYTYTITLTGGCGMITAQGAIRVNAIPTAGSIAGNQTICYSGDPLMITNQVGGTGSGTISYRWESSLTGGAPWTVISGVTTAFYDPAGPMTATTWYRRITISDFNGIQCESVATNVVKVTVQPLLSPGAIAASQTICYNTLPNNLTSTDNGGNPGGYGTPVWRWEYSTNSGVTWTVITGATSSGYLFTGPLTQTTWYRRSSGYSYDGVECYSLPTDPLIITVQSLVNAGGISPDRTICENDDPPAFSSTPASGDGSISYQWQSSVDGIIFTNIPLATAETYDPGALTSDRWYRRIAISTLNGVTCQAISNIVKITVINIVTAGTISANQLLCPGESPAPFTSTAPAGGDGNITYQWQISLTGSGAGFSDIPGATSSTYTPLASAVNTWYRRMAFFTINGVTCSIASGELYIYIVSFNPGTITPFNNDTIFCSGENPGLISGTPFVSPPVPPVITLTGYRWQSNTTGNPADFANITGATNQNYDPPALTVTTWFRRVVDVKAQGKDCSAPGNIVTLRVFPTPTLSVTSPVTVCQGSPYTITAIAGNTGVFPPSYTLHYVSGTYVTPPADTTNSTGIFILNPPVLPSPSPVGQQHFTVTVTNGDPGACSAVMPVTVEINDIPDITLTPSCSSTTGNGVITMTGVVTYPVGAVVEYRIMANPSGSWSAWQTNPLFTGLGIGSYTVEARNSLAPSCTVQLIGEILALTVGTVDYTICQNGTVPAGQGLIGNSYCITWANANAHTGTECTDAAHTYVMSSSEYPPYTAGSLVQYAVYATVWAPLGEMTIKDCPNVPGRTYSIYVYPFDPLNPGQNFVRMVPNTCPGGSGWVIIPLDPNLTYQIILNSPGPATSVCTQVQFTTADKIQVAVSIAPVNWYQTPTSETIIHTGSPFNPYGTPYLPAGSCPGSYPFYAGCAAGLCREPAYFIINPRPIVTSVNDTICTGQYTDILLVSKDSCNNPVDPSKVTYEWTASVLSGSATGFSDCALNCGAVIHQQLFSTSNASCPVVRYMVRAKVGECYGSWYPVDVLIINIASITLPVPPANVSYACQGDVPPPEPLTAPHACLGTLTAQGVDTDNGGTGCPSNPLIITRTWTFVDACGTFAVSQIIRVSDSIPPTFTPPPDTTVYTDELCYYVDNPLYTGDVTDESDNCSTGLEATYSDIITNGPCQGSWIITRTWSLTDICGNTTTKDQIITVMDSIPPSFTRPTDIIIPSDTNCAYNISVTVTGDVTNETDNCSTGLQATFTDTPDETDPCHIIVSRTWHLVDDCGNAAADQVQTITVEDILPPTFTRPADITIYTDANCEYDAGVGVTGDVTNEHDNCSTGLEATFTDIVSPGPCEGSHIIHRTWQLMDNCGNMAPDQVQIITVSDTTPPTFDRPADITIYADANCNYDATLAVTGDATNVGDNCSTGILPTHSDVTNNGSCIGEKIIHRTWSLVDHCGNHAADQVQTITVLDTISPQFSSLPDTIRSFCVIDIITAIYYPDTMDISPVRPDYYILSDADKNSLNLDPSTFLDNCTPSSSMTVHWRIDFNGGTPPPITGTGLISGYPGEIRFEGAPNAEVTHSITYWLEDDCNNLSSEVKVWIIVKPRPDVVKITN